MPVAALGGNLPGWCVDVGMCVTGASELSRAAASRFTPLQGGNGGHSSVWPPASRLPGDDVGVAPKLPYLAGK